MIDPLHPLQSIILETLAEYPALNVAELLKIVQEKHQQSVSRTNLYRSVSQLVDEQVLVRNQGKLSLNLVWVSYIHGFGKRMYEAYLKDKKVLADFPLQEGQTLEATSDSLFALDALWNHLMLKIVKLAKERVFYVYNSHPWHILGLGAVAMRFYQGIVQEGFSRYTLYGNNGFLDHYAASLITVPNFYCAFDAHVSFPREGCSLWVCDDYILECLFPPILNRHFEALFKTIESVDQLDMNLFENLFRMKTPCRVTVRRVKKESGEIRQNIKRYFEKPASPRAIRQQKKASESLRQRVED